MSAHSVRFWIGDIAPKGAVIFSQSESDIFCLRKKWYSHGVRVVEYSVFCQKDKRNKSMHNEKGTTWAKTQRTFAYVILEQVVPDKVRRDLVRLCTKSQ